mgnify:CR=1 FL=1
MLGPLATLAVVLPALGRAVGTFTGRIAVVLAAGLSPLAPEILYARYGVRAIAKRMLSKAEKKKFGL